MFNLDITEHNGGYKYKIQVGENEVIGWSRDRKYIMECYDKIRARNPHEEESRIKITPGTMTALVYNVLTSEYQSTGLLSKRAYDAMGDTYKLSPSLAQVERVCNDLLEKGIVQRSSKGWRLINRSSWL